VTSKVVFDFLRHVGREPGLVHELRARSKPEVLERARQLGYDFPEQDFDDSVWGVEGFLAAKVGEPFDSSFSLWETMWGKYYLEYLVDNVVKGLSDEDIAQFFSQGRANP
jgi:hypothetical protein